MFPVKSLELERSTEFDLNTLFGDFNYQLIIKFDSTEWNGVHVVLFYSSYV